MRDPETLARINALTIPPAWREVWICPDPRGHLQATGIDAAGRKQYLYHEGWRAKRDAEKFRRMLRFGRALRALRRRVAADLAGEGETRERVLACAVRLLDVGLFRIGCEEYADGDGGLGLATVEKRHLAFRGRSMVFDYPAKSGVRRVQAIDDPQCAELLRALKLRRGGGTTLLAHRDGGRRWVAVRSDEINEYIKAAAGEEFTAKDFRTWNATVLAAVALAAAPRAASEGGRRRAIDGAVRGVAEALGNTPAVARRAYIDPHVFDRYRAGSTIASALAGGAADGARARARVERAVLDLLS